MTESEKALKAALEALEVATTAAQMASQITALLHQSGMLHPNLSARFSTMNRHLGLLFEQYGDDEIASDFGAIANLLRSSPPAQTPNPE